MPYVDAHFVRSVEPERPGNDIGVERRLKVFGVCIIALDVADERGLIRVFRISHVLIGQTMKIMELYA